MSADLVRCILRPRKPDARPMTFCGRTGLLAGWCFNDLSHVIRNAEEAGRLLPCPACLGAVITTLTGLKQLTEKNCGKP
jgi:hypothetical protein